MDVLNFSEICDAMRKVKSLQKFPVCCGGTKYMSPTLLYMGDIDSGVGGSGDPRHNVLLFSCKCKESKRWNNERNKHNRSWEKVKHDLYPFNRGCEPWTHRAWLNVCAAQDTSGDKDPRLNQHSWHAREHICYPSSFRQHDGKQEGEPSHEGTWLFPLYVFLSRFASGNVFVDLVNQADHGSHRFTDNRNVGFRMGDPVSFLCDHKGTHGKEVGEGERESGGVHAITVSRSPADHKRGNVKLWSGSQSEYPCKNHAKAAAGTLFAIGDLVIGITG